VGDQLRQAEATVKDAAQDAVARGADLAGEAKEKVLEATEEGKDQVTAHLEDVAEAVHRSGEQLVDHQDWLAKLVEHGAEELDNLASTLRSNDLRGLMGKLENMARNQPMIFTSAAMAAGFASARLGKVVVKGEPRSGSSNGKEAEHGPK
jgi:hypothetical protein